MNFARSKNCVRVDFFTRSTYKYRDHSAVKMDNDLYYDKRGPRYSLAKILVEEFHLMLANGTCNDSMKDTIAVCLEPYHEHSFPVIIDMAHIDEILSK